MELEVVRIGNRYYVYCNRRLNSAVTLGEKIIKTGLRTLVEILEEYNVQWLEPNTFFQFFYFKDRKNAQKFVDKINSIIIINKLIGE